MHCIFITRCYRATNIQTIKDNLKAVLGVDGVRRHTFTHIILADMTRGMMNLEDVTAFDDFTRTVSLLTTEKAHRDEYQTKAIDDYLKVFKEKDCPRTYVYILDDDNQITPDFLDALDACVDGEPDAVVFKVYGHPEWGDISILDHDAVGKIDWSNMLIRLDVMKRLKVYTIGADSQKSDGFFFEKMKRDGCRIKFLNQICGRYNALPKP